MDRIGLENPNRRTLNNRIEYEMKHLITLDKNSSMNWSFTTNKRKFKQVTLVTILFESTANFV